MRVLGIDPGSLTTGWGVVSGVPARPELIGSGIIRLARAGALADRLHRLRIEIASVVHEWNPASAAVEAPFHGPNARAALRLAHARGVVLAVLAEAGLEVTEYTPATVKQAVTGNGQASKQQVRAMVERLLGARIEVRAADLSDALAVAWCHVARSRFAERVRRAEAAGRTPGPADRDGAAPRFRR